MKRYALTLPNRSVMFVTAAHFAPLREKYQILTILYKCNTAPIRNPTPTTRLASSLAFLRAAVRQPGRMG